MESAPAWHIGLVTQINPVADALVGEWLSLPEVATRLSLPIGRVKQLLRDRKLIAVTRPCGDRAVPAAFINGEQIVKGLSGTLTVLYDCGFEDEEALRWLFTADETLPGTPIDALYARRGTEVNRRAQALAFLSPGDDPPVTPSHGRASPLRSFPTGDGAKSDRRFARPRCGAVKAWWLFCWQCGSASV